MRKRLMIAIALPLLLTGAVSLDPGCAIAGTLTGLPCCYESGGRRYSSTYGSDDKCKKPAAWLLCLQWIESRAEGIA